MSLNIRNVFQAHSFHLTSPSPWTLFSSISLLSITTTGVMFMHGFSSASLFFFTSLISVVYSMALWFRYIVSEATYLGNHTLAMQRGLNVKIGLYMVSEALVFLAIFWTFFHNALSPNVELGAEWPPMGIQTINRFELPLLNTVILLSYRVAVKYAHRLLIQKESSEDIYGLLYTNLLAIVLFCFLWLVGYQLDKGSLIILNIILLIFALVYLSLLSYEKDFFERKRIGNLMMIFATCLTILGSFAALSHAYYIEAFFVSTTTIIILALFIERFQENISFILKLYFYFLIRNPFATLYYTYFSFGFISILYISVGYLFSLPLISLSFLFHLFYNIENTNMICYDLMENYQLLSDNNPWPSEVINMFTSNVNGNGPIGGPPGGPPGPNDSEMALWLMIREWNSNIDFRDLNSYIMLSMFDNTIEKSGLPVDVDDLSIHMSLAANCKETNYTRYHLTFAETNYNSNILWHNFKEPYSLPYSKNDYKILEGSWSSDKFIGNYEFTNYTEQLLWHYHNYERYAEHMGYTQGLNPEAFCRIFPSIEEAVDNNQAFCRIFPSIEEAVDNNQVFSRPANYDLYPLENYNSILEITIERIQEYYHKLYDLESNWHTIGVNELWLDQNLNMTMLDLEGQLDHQRNMTGNRIEEIRNAFIAVSTSDLDNVDMTARYIPKLFMIWEAYSYEAELTKYNDILASPILQQVYYNNPFVFSKIPTAVSQTYISSVCEPGTIALLVNRLNPVFVA